MKKVLLQRKDLDALVAAMSEGSVVYAPAADGKDASGIPLHGTVFRPVRSAAEMSLEETNTRLSVKGVFFPQREVMMRIVGGRLAEDPAGDPAPGGSLVAFGVRPCDAKSLLFLDTVFSGSTAAPGNVRHEDPYYLERRRNSLVIALACDEPCESCFCTSVGGSPHGTEGADILASWTDTAKAPGQARDGAMLLEAVTEKGEAFLEAHSRLFAPASHEAVRAREARAAAAAARMRVLDLAGVKQKAEAAFESPLWDAITRSCLGCGACTYLCPTCHCFDITDETRGAAGVRLRSWDACQFPLYSLHASGHNPRPSRKSRMRQRIMHKYSYTVETAGMVSCSGCGRCVRLCPVNLDIRQMLAALKEAP